MLLAKLVELLGLLLARVYVNMVAALAQARVASHVATSQQEIKSTRQELKGLVNKNKKGFDVKTTYSENKRFTANKSIN